MPIIRIIVLRCIYTMLLLSLATPSFTQSAISKEYQLKAIFLYNFAQFVEWPLTAFPDEEAPLIIGVLGEDPFGKYLDETIRDEKIDKHNLVVQRFQKPEDVTNCHILFINYKKPDDIKKALVNIKSKATLTVSDFPAFTQSGGIIGFFMDNSKIRIQINLDVAKDSNLTISSKLLRLAEIVKTENN
jgi:hypothetical protein